MNTLLVLTLALIPALSQAQVLTSPPPEGKVELLLKYRDTYRDRVLYQSRDQKSYLRVYNDGKIALVDQHRNEHQLKYDRGISDIRRHLDTVGDRCPVKIKIDTKEMKLETIAASCQLFTERVDPYADDMPVLPASFTDEAPAATPADRSVEI
jgi:hypothetical protein